MQKSSYNNQKGFTLVETLVALSIFTISIIGLISATAGGINNVTYSKNKIAAMALAGEGVELVRNIRDTDAIGSTTGWADFTSQMNACSSSVGCAIDAEALTVSACTSGGCPALRKYINASSASYFGYQGSDTTPFVRTIKVSSVSPDEVLVTSTVSWLQGAGTKSVSTVEHLMNWFTAASSAPITP